MSSSHNVRCTASIARHNMEKAGLPRAPWRNAIHSEIVAYGIVWKVRGRGGILAAVKEHFSICGGAGVDVGAPVGWLTTHSFIDREQVPARTALPLRLTQREVAFISEVHPSLQSIPMEIRAPTGENGKICARRTEGERWGSNSLHVCVDVTVLPLGMVATTGCISTRLFVCGLLADT